ncbi:MAG: phenylalanine--tRNA ligase subunit beta [Oscillospiraceae bacterium]|nr:phenylalanine--tRNA ligase subunit beta [Oscillospiraceae bacterium]
MKLSRKWLAEFTEVDAPAREYAERMTISGSKVEATEEPSKEIENVVVGKVVEIERHPDSDHLWICQVDVGQDEPIQIVTGAQNVNAGDLVPVAMHKSLLPGGIKITKGKLRGVPSNGMLCSLGELKLDTHDFPYAITDGIFIIKEDCRPGDDIRPLIGADDSIVEFEITNNRPDCLSVIGLARETAATFGTELKLHKPEVKGAGGDINEHLSVEIKNPDLCPRYTARMVKNIKIEPSPLWMRQRLRASGVRPINNIVDITNYVMLEYGQPMHAFDYACLDEGKIIVRTAEDGEIMNTLDDQERKLDSTMLVIADSSKPVAVAGVMGGANSEITDNTKFVVFESANFNGTSVRRTAAKLTMRTDASGRFEKGLDQENTWDAVQRACELVEMLGAGEVIDGIIDVIAKEYEPLKLDLQPDRINALLGTDISEEFMAEALESLGFTVENGVVTVPSWRGDIEHYSDLAEEVARLYGYNDIEPTMLKGETTMGALTVKQSLERQVASMCRALGFSEIYTYSFISPSAYDKIRLAPDSSLRNSVRILNPLGEDTSVMRTTSLPSMLEIMSRNNSYRNENVRLYELARIYRNIGEELPDERVILTLGAYGDTDFFKMKGAVEAILKGMRIENVSFEAESENPSYHPGRCAVVKSGDTVLGVMGQLHPLTAAAYDLGESYAVELDFYNCIAARSEEKGYEPIPRYPAITRDIAVVVDDEVTIASLVNTIKKAGGKLLKGVKLFDIYKGEHIQAGKKSTAFSLKLRADDQTLTDQMADDTVNGVLTAIKDELGGVIR